MVNKYLEIEDKKRPVSPLSTEEGIHAILKEQGFGDVKSLIVEENFRFKSKEAWWKDLNYTAVRNILDAIDERGLLKDFKEEAFEGLDQFIDGEEVVINRKAILAYGKVGS